MTDDVLHIPDIPQNLDFHIVTLFEKLETLRQESNCKRSFLRLPLQAEVRTLEFWRSVICECIASFCYVFVVCGAAAGTGIGATMASVLLATSLSAGFAMTTLSQCFLHISGGHINPSVTVAMVVTKRITIIRGVMYVIAQSGGAVAGAAFIYGVTVPTDQGNFLATVAHSSNVAAFERFGVEVILTFLVVLTYLMSTDTYNKFMGSTSLTIGASYAACSFVFMPYLNPARSLGPSFVLSKWESHWVYWLGPLSGGVISGLLFEYVFNKHRTSRPKNSGDGDSSSINSDEDTYDDLDKPSGTKFTGSTYNSYRPAGTNNGTSGYCASLASASLYAAPSSKLERVESLYGGTKSLYCKSPPLTRANLNRSQSVYTKSNSGSTKDSTIPRPGPLVPAQSLYPMRLNQQQNHVQNQNVQNQLQQRSESIYGIRGASQRSEGAYGANTNTNGSFQARNNTNSTVSKYEENQNPTRGTRPESMYGISQNRRGQSAQSDDSSYSSYHGSVSRNNNVNSSTYTGPSSNFPSKGNNNIVSVNSAYGVRSDIRKSPPTHLLTAASHATPFLHTTLPQHSPSSQY